MWDNQLDRILCECHMALFNVDDGSVYRTGRDVKIKSGLRPIQVMVDHMKAVFIVD